MDREGNGRIRLAVAGKPLPGFLPFLGQCRKYVLTVFPSENQAPADATDLRGVIVEKVQLIRQRDTANAGINAVNPENCLIKMGQRRNPGTSPGIEAFDAGLGCKVVSARQIQLGKLRKENGQPRTVSGHC